MSSAQCGSPSRAAWVAVRTAAVDAATRGWPVTPGTYPGRARAAHRWCGRPGADLLRPAADGWRHHPITDPGVAGDVWAHRPYGVLLVCGAGVDVLEINGLVAEVALPALGGAGLGGPLAAAGTPWRWLLYVASGPTLSPALRHAGVVLRGRGQWAALPPTQLRHNQAQWLIEPEWVAPELPHSDAVQKIIADAVDGRERHATPARR